MPDREPRDEAARRRITTDLDTTLFVEAGAGSGKTTALVDRVVALVTTGAAELRSIAAITFTEKAGAELRDRVRQELGKVVADPRSAAAAMERADAALDELDGAAIGTLHSFAQRVLSEHPVEAGLPPRVEVLDEVSSGVAFERRWAAFRDELFEDPSMERTILLLLAAGVKHGALRSLALAFDRNWDLVAERVPDTAPEPPRAHDALGPALAALDEVCRARQDCHDPDDLLCVRLDEISRYADHLRAIDGELELMVALGRDAVVKPPSFKAGNLGSKKTWPDKAMVHDAIRAAGAQLDEVLATVANACAPRIGSALRCFTLGSADERRASGQLEFHDLLVMARSLLRDPDHGSAVRTALHQHYQRLLLDEFQDTDPIQIELAVRIASAAPAAPETGAAPWDRVDIAPGRLFVVGDPKQSIYRFRRADISLFLKARDRYGPEGGGVVELTTNFRTGDGIISWVNATFGRLLAEEPDVEVPVPSQPAYVALDPWRDTPPVGPSVAVLGRAPHPTRAVDADAVRAAEAADVAATIGRAVAEGWSVGEGRAWRPARLGDIAILVPARTSLPFLEDALEAASIPYRAESSSLVYASRAVRDLLMVLRAVDDPTDHLRIVSALRTPLLACGDDDLFRFKVSRKGSWSYLGEQPDTVPVEDPVRAGLQALQGWHERRRWSSPSELAGRIVRERRAMELGFVEGRPRDVWRRLRFVVDQARAWSEATGGGLREYLAWVDGQTAEGARVAEAVLPETDDDAVRIMTIHAAKGLEFPITIVSGMTTASQPSYAIGDARFPPEEGVAYRFGKDVRTPEFIEFQPIDEQMAFDERVRLLYVATTRAQDHLVLSLHRRERGSPPKSSNLRTNAELLAEGMGDLIDEVPDGAPDEQSGERAPLARWLDPAPVPAFEVWAAERHEALRRASRPTAVAATSLTAEGTPDAGEADPGLQKRPRDLDLPPWLKGRYGTKVGRAVHGVLQTIDLATGAGLDDAVSAQCEAEAVPDRAGEVADLVRRALGSPSVREAAASAHWREVYACTPVDGRLLEGYVDLLYRTPDGLVVVDHKTAATSDRAALHARVEGYRFQGASYALAVAASTGEVVVRVTFLFLTPDGAVEMELPDLAAAVAEVRALVSAGEELVVDAVS